MTLTTYEEAKRCPKCETPGQETSQRPRPDGSKLVTIFCRNERCSWCNTPWVVQVNADGSIPEATTNREKSFPQVPDLTDRTQASMERLYNQTITGGETR